MVKVAHQIEHKIKNQCKTFHELRELCKFHENVI